MDQQPQLIRLSMDALRRCGLRCGPGRHRPDLHADGNDVGDQMYVEVTAGNTGGYGATVNSAEAQS